MNDLKDCPFCGGEGKLFSMGKEVKFCFFVACIDCNIGNKMSSEEVKVVESWNKRVKCGEC